MIFDDLGCLTIDMPTQVGIVADMNNTTNTKMKIAKERAAKVHEQVCDVHYDYSVMNRDKTCSECQNDYHELQILAR